MTRPEEFTVYQATDPATPPAMLEAMAGARPDLRAFVAANPATRPEVLDWLASLDDVAVDAALRRRAPDPGARWAAPAQLPPPQGPAVAAPGQLPYGGQHQPPRDVPGQPPAGAPHGAPHQPPAGGSQPPHGAPSANPYAPPASPSPGYGPQPGPAPYGGAPQPAGGHGYGYGHQVPGPTTNRTGLIVAIVVGSLVLIGALVFAATSIVGTLEGSDYGDDAGLDALWQACEAGDGAACDDLYRDSPLGSEYEEYGDTCGFRFPPHSVWCEDVM